MKKKKVKSQNLACIPARTWKIQRHIGRARGNLVPIVLDRSDTGGLQDLIRRRRHEPVAPGTLVLDPDEYLHQQLLAPLGLSSAHHVDVLEILASRSEIVIVSHGRPERTSFLLVLQSLEIRAYRINNRRTDLKLQICGFPGKKWTRPFFAFPGKLGFNG